ncbi:kinase-like domain-containing protein [Abortiporus biennis]|nr:kinase-like domain-containing protein [Abortiporus biennis]
MPQVLTRLITPAVVSLEADISKFKEEFALLKDEFEDKEDVSALQSHFDLWDKKYRRYSTTPTFQWSSSPTLKILQLKAYLKHMAYKRSQSKELTSLGNMTTDFYKKTSTAARERFNSSKRCSIDKENHMDAGHCETDAIVTVEMNKLSLAEQPCLPQNIFCTVCRSSRYCEELVTWDRYHLCDSAIQPFCQSFVGEVQNLVYNIVGNGMNFVDFTIYFGHGDFLNELSVILVADDQKRIDAFISQYKGSHDFTQFALDSLQQILDAQQFDWRKPNLLRSRLCRLLGNLCRECDLISFPSSLAVSVRFDTTRRAIGGGFALVYFGHLPRDKTTTVAIKMHHASTFDTHTKNENRHYSKRFLYELMMWRNMSHRCIAKFIGLFTEGKSHCMVIQYFSNGSLASQITDYLNKTPLETIRIDCRRWMLDIAEGLLYLHLQGYAHGDIHGGNILLDANMHAVISDFGTAVYNDAPVSSNGSVESRGGIKHFIAPEMLPELHNPYDLKDKRPTKAGDVFSFGSVSAQMHNGLHAYGVPDEDNPAEIISVKIEHIRKFWEDGRCIPKPRFKSTMEYMEDGLWKILNPCFHFNPQHRPGIEDIFRQLVSYFGVHECGCGVQDCDRGDRRSLLLND